MYLSLPFLSFSLTNEAYLVTMSVTFVLISLVISFFTALRYITMMIPTIRIVIMMLVMTARTIVPVDDSEAVTSKN